MTDVTIASVLGLIGGTLSLFELSGSSSFRLLTTPSASSGATYSLPALFLVAGLVGASLVLSLLGLWLYRSAFLTLSVADRSFSGPATLVLVGILGILFVVVSGSALLAAILRAVYCSGVANPISTSCVNYGEVALLAVAVFGAAIVAVIGYIGLLVGIWRLGTRFDDGLFKAGAVLMLFPLLNLVGSILVLLAARSARRRHGIL